MEELVLSIEELDEDGRGVAHVQGREIHVAGALPGETIRARVVHESPHAPRAWADLVAFTGERSPERVPPACPGHGRCGGCVLQHLAYPAQLTYKRRLVEKALGRSVDDVVAAPRELHYRNRGKYVLFAAPGGAGIGSFAPGSHDIVDMAGCQVPEEPIDEIARAAARLLGKERLSIYDEATRAGELRHLVVRANPDGQTLVVIVTRTRAPAAALTRVARALRAEQRGVAGIVHNLNPSPGNVIFGDTDHVLDGAPTLDDEIAGIPLALSARSFFQVNRAQAARLYDAAVRAAEVHRGTRAVDLFSGVGLIALSLARAGARVAGVESLPEAVADARATAERLRLPARFFAADAAAGLDTAIGELGGLDVLVVNPPRKGLGAALRKKIIAAAPPRLVYVSCGPRSLAEDVAALEAAGWRLLRATPYDLMPGTPQVETLAVLTRRGSAR